MQGCSGYVTTAGFESVCEAMYLGKPVMMIPTHVEQEINAAMQLEPGRESRVRLSMFPV